MRIVYCIDELEATGGIERVTVVKANALVSVPNNEVFIVVAYSRKSSRYPVDPRIRVMDLGIRYYDDSGLSRWRESWFILRKRREHRKLLRQALNQIAPDILISTGMSEKFFISGIRVKSKPIRIREIHFMSNYRSFLARDRFEKIVAWIGEKLDFYLMSHKFDKIIVLSDRDKKENWKGIDKVMVIPNCIDTFKLKKSSLDEKIVISAGRLVTEKNFSSMISAWKKVVEIHSDWQLHIYGEGPLMAELQKQKEIMNLNEVVQLKGYSNHLIDLFSEASIACLSSSSEGFSLLLLEAMACGLPLVAYDCPYGPRELIRNGENGFLIPLNDEDELAKSLCRLIEDKKLRRIMGSKGKKMASSFDANQVKGTWMRLFQELLNEQRRDV